MFDGYNYTRNLVLKNLKDYKYYVCIQNFDKTVESQSKWVYSDTKCYFGDNITFGSKVIEHLHNSNGYGRECSFSSTTKYPSNLTYDHASSVCVNISADSINFNNRDFIYTNVPNEHRANIIEDIEYIKNNNLAYNQNFMYIIPFTSLLIVLALWWFRK